MADGKNDKLKIRLHVYDTEFTVRVLPEDEEYYRNAAKLITDTINTYANAFKGQKGDKDLLYMALIEIALRYEKELSRNDVQPFSELLSKLTSEIEEVI